MTFHPCENAEPIPGYLLKERIGVGGYGEVWKVSAPGGLTKAIKFVYGRMDDERAARELKALGRIKEVRHPFLLSLERFDVFDGQLIVVTELADMSLMDRFRECRDEGLPGIPRNELVDHLRDAADALDYMSDKYGLQHLDIKPENLLLVGGRIKVADFGLVKDLQDAHATAIGGVTPLYATPEAFDGKASRQSDQYSLAIVYQEMLTGSLPFPGMTAVQLAVQHMHSPPLLDSLPDSDRPTIARALSKLPAQRFSACREMVNHLADAGTRAAAPAETPKRQAAQRDEGETAGDGGQPRSTVDVRSTPCGSFLDETSNHRQTSNAFQPEERELALPPLEAPNVDAGIRPTVFIGIGGTAALVLRRLRRRLQQRFGDREAVPSFQFLLLDTDSEALRAAEQGDPEDALLPRETVYLPLRKPSEYRAASDKILGWLSRRWLYNIPRSLRTEGLRPLGRLAYVDHAELVKAKMREALAESVSPEALAKTAKTAGAGLRNDAPRVFLISSISGGTGGGMLFDAAYAVRELLAEMGFDQRDVCGVLSHATLNKNAANDLRKANAYAALTELHHFNQCAGGFKSGAASVLPAGELSEPPFTDSYLINLGDELSEAELETRCGAVARYLYLDVATACGRLLDQCREATRKQIEADDGIARLRSFAIHAIGCDKHSLAATQADGLCRRLVSDWHSEARSRRRPDKPELEVEELTRRLYAAADKALAGGAAEHFRIAIEQANMISEACAPGAEQGSPFAEHLERIRALVGADAAPDEPALAEPTRLETGLQDAAQKLAAALGGSIEKSITAMVENPHDRLPTALLAVRMFQDQLRDHRQDADEEFRRLNSESAEIRSKLDAGEVPRRARRWFGLLGSDPRDDADAFLTEYCEGRLRALILQQLSSLLQSVSASVAALNERLQQLRTKFEQLERSFASTLPSGESANRQPMVGQPARRGPAAPVAGQPVSEEFFAAFEEKFQQNVLAPHGGLMALAAANNEQWKQLRTRLQVHARECVLMAMKEVNAAALLAQRHPQQEQLVKHLASAAEKSTPPLPLPQAARRVFTLVPDAAGGAAVAKAIEQGVPRVALSIADADSDLVFCHEAELLSLPRTAAALIGNRPDYAAAALRVLTRLDIPWCSLPLGNDRPAASETREPETVAQG